MTDSVLGIDIAKKKFDVALLQDGNYKMATFTNDRRGFTKLVRWLKNGHVGQLHACLEATGSYGEALALFLHETGFCVSNVNPSRIKAYAESQLRRNKTDREDAKVIAHFCLTQQPSHWTPPPPAQRELRSMSRHLNALKKMRTQELNRLKSGANSTIVHSALEEHIAFLDAQIQQLADQIQEHISNRDMLKKERKLIQSIPGFGRLSAAKLLAEVPDLTAFASAAQLAAYAGLTPRQKESGSSIHKRARLSKTGNTHIRAILYFPAMVAIRHNPIVRALAERLEARGKSPMTIIGAAMRKLLFLAFGVVKTDKPFDPNHHVNILRTT
jgi:transposase